MLFSPSLLKNLYSKVIPHITNFFVDLCPPAEVIPPTHCKSHFMTRYVINIILLNTLVIFLSVNRNYKMLLGS